MIYISPGNRKLKGCSIFNLPSGLTCKPLVQCRNYCYAKKAERIYPAVTGSRIGNEQESHLNMFPENMRDILSKRRSEVVRIHESGDFYSSYYIIKWYRIAEFLPNKKLFAYTKRDDLFTKDLLKSKPENLTLLWSIDGIKKNNEPIEEETHLKLEEGYDKVTVVRESRATCPHQIDKRILCIADCRLCLEGNRKLIEFKKH